MLNNILASSEYACSGCGACVTICAQDAIQIEMNDTGFYVAQVDSDKCVDCGFCQKVCNRYDSDIQGKSLYEVPLYALQSSCSDVVKKCSSGGIAHEISRWAIQNRRKVVGVAYNTEANRAEHRIANNLEEIIAFTGSKYIQSNPEKAFRVVIDSARKNQSEKYVVFGTPCQITGLAKVCEKLYIRDQFVLVEIFCHGVPSYYVWDEQCKSIAKKLGTEIFDSVQFRYKKTDWHSYCMKVEGAGKTFYGKREKELFWHVFFENVLLGDSCFNCRMRKTKSMADIRLGDYWGSKFQNRKDGVSAVFACTKQGRDIIKTLDSDNQLCQLDATSVGEMLAVQNMAGYHQQELHDGAMKMLRESGNILKTVKWYQGQMSRKQKIKRRMLLLSSVVPDGIRVKLKRMRSNLQLKVQ